MIDWFLMPTLAVFQLYRSVNKFYKLITNNQMKTCAFNTSSIKAGMIHCKVGISIPVFCK